MQRVLSVREPPERRGMRAHHVIVEGRRKAIHSLLGLLAVVLVVLMSLAACETDGLTDDAPDTPRWALDGGQAADETTTVRITLASTDLGVGPNRLAFGLVNVESGPIREADVLISTFYLGDGRQEGPIQTARAVWRRWPIAQAGLYTASFDFDREGAWGVVANYVDHLGSSVTVSAGIEVKPKSATPSIGERPPASVTKLAKDFENLKDMTSDPEPDEELYAMTVAEGLNAGKPLVVAFSTPAFCRTATCGPQLDVIKELKGYYYRDVNFIHVEVYDSPADIEGNLSNAPLAQAMIDWALPTEPWTFVMDADGKVAAKFEAFATKDELEAALDAVLR